MIGAGLALGALAAAPALRGVSVDSWAVDYVPLGADGRALRRPYAYRDARTRGRLDEAVARIAGGADALYARTGIQFLPFNTLPQVVADLADEPAAVVPDTEAAPDAQGAEAAQGAGDADGAQDAGGAPPEATTPHPDAEEVAAAVGLSAS